MRSPYMPIPAEIEGIVDETPTIKTFAIRPAEAIPFEAGQFLELTVPGIGEAPFTPSSSPSIADRVEITTEIRGQYFQPRSWTATVDRL